MGRFTLTIAARNLTANPMRSLLTSLGLLIGVSGVIAIVAVGEGVKAYFRRELSQLGSNLMFIIPQAEMEEGRLLQVAKKFKNEDINFLNLNSTTTLIVYGASQTEVLVRAKGRSRNVDITGGNPVSAEVLDLKFSHGRMFNHSEHRNRAKVAVLGNKVKQWLFPGVRDPVGETIRIKGVNFKVIGVVKPRGRIGGSPDWDRIIFIPLPTFQAYISGKDEVEWITAATKTPEELGVSSNREAIKLAEAELTRLLRVKRKIKNPSKDDFLILTPTDFLEFGDTFFNILIIVFGVVAMVALVVGSIGIMNMMLVSVSERTREIGLRKALGATRRSIVLQFLLETSFLTLTGGLLGLLVGYAAGELLSLWLSSTGIFSGEDIFHAAIPLPYILITLGVSVSVGIGAGIWPAIKAATLDPIEALRYE